MVRASSPATSLNDLSAPPPQSASRLPLPGRCIKDPRNPAVRWALQPRGSLSVLTGTCRRPGGVQLGPLQPHRRAPPPPQGSRRPPGVASYFWVWRGKGSVRGQRTGALRLAS